MNLKTAVALALVSALGAGCADKSRCKTICQKEAKCVESGDDIGRFDQSECIEVCKDLERDELGAEIVARHAACLEKADSCEVALRCQ